MVSNKRYVCNQLYRHLIDDETAEQICFLTDEEFRDQSRLFPEAVGVIGQPFFMNAAFMDRAPKLKWVQVTGAGYDAADVEEIRRRELILTNSRGVMSISIAEDVMLKLLFFSRKGREVEQNKLDHKWNSFDQDQWMCTCYFDLYGKKLGIVGYGSIGHEIAVRAKAFGMEVSAYSRHPYHVPELDHSYTGPDGLDQLLRESDCIVLAIPLTKDTYHLIDDDAFDKMKSTAVLVNVARGSVVDEQALCRALREKKIAWAACDVFEKEPLPKESPLWELDRLFITSHKAGMGDLWPKLIGQLIVRNIHHFDAGEPLENVIKL